MYHCPNVYVCLHLFPPFFSFSRKANLTTYPSFPPATCAPNSWYHLTPQLQGCPQGAFFGWHLLKQDFSMPCECCPLGWCDCQLCGFPPSHLIKNFSLASPLHHQSLSHAPRLFESAYNIATILYLKDKQNPRNNTNNHP